MYVHIEICSTIERSILYSVPYHVCMQVCMYAYERKVLHLSSVDVVGAGDGLLAVDAADVHGRHGQLGGLVRPGG